MNWLLIDNLMPNVPVAINLDTITDIVWNHGTLTFETVDSKSIEYECEQSVFIEVVSQLNIIKELES